MLNRTESNEKQRGPPTESTKCYHHDSSRRNRRLELQWVRILEEQHGKENGQDWLDDVNSFWMIAFPCVCSVSRALPWLPYLNIEIVQVIEVITLQCPQTQALQHCRDTEIHRTQRTERVEAAAQIAAGSPKNPNPLLRQDNCVVIALRGKFAAWPVLEWTRVFPPCLGLAMQRFSHDVWSIWHAMSMKQHPWGNQPGQVELQQHPSIYCVNRFRTALKLFSSGTCQFWQCQISHKINCHVIHPPAGSKRIITIWLSNIAMENHHFQ